MRIPILYQLEDCPYCKLVKEKLEEKNIEYQNVNVIRSREDKLRKELFEKSGVPTVPVLQIGNKYIGESKDIIKYLEKIP
ncbi:MAG TPA: glutaredoxin [Candidatus Nanoarchaeia archaeon]|nr:glutaredoxin [Candidatus Nanoarchaeia archaeon]